MNIDFHDGARVLAGLTLWLAGAACGGQALAAPDSADLLAQIEAARGAAVCDSDAQCHTIGVGAKACGGPERYLAWSSKTGDGARLQALVEQHAQLRRAADAKTGAMSNCAEELDPGARCVADRCALRETDPGGGDQAR